MSLSESAEMTVDDVYKLAHDIAEEFEKIVQLNGIDAVKPLVEKVINALELLEYSVGKIEQLEIKLKELTSSNLHLSSLKLMNDQVNANLKQSYEEAEESWLQEIIALKSLISSLECENKSLRSDLSVREEEVSAETEKSVIENQENTLHRLRHYLRQKDEQLQDSATKICSLNGRIEELLKFNKILHLQNQEAKKDITHLVMEKYESKSEWIPLKKENIHGHIDSYKPKEHLDRRESELMEKVRRLQLELQVERGLSRQYEEKLLQLSFDKREKSFPSSRVYEFFNLFLGVASTSEFCLY